MSNNTQQHNKQSINISINYIIIFICIKFAKELCVIGKFTNKHMDKRGIGTGSPVLIPVTNKLTNKVTGELTVPVNGNFIDKNSDSRTFTLNNITSPNISFL